MATVLKTVGVKTSVGSNPTSSAIFIVAILGYNGFDCFIGKFLGVVA